MKLRALLPLALLLAGLLKKSMAFCVWVSPFAKRNARTYGPPGLEEDIAFCAREDRLDVVPRFSGMVGAAAEITL